MRTNLSTGARARCIFCRRRIEMRALRLVLLAAAALHGQAVQRTIQENPLVRRNEAKAPADATATNASQALESIFASSEDLNAIRDGYLRRLSGDGCPTDVAI